MKLKVDGDRTNVLVVDDCDVVELPGIWVNRDEFFVISGVSSEFTIDGMIGMWGKDTINKLPYYMLDQDGNYQKIIDPVVYCKYQVVKQISKDVKQLFDDGKITLATFANLPEHMQYDSRFPFVVWETIQEHVHFKIVGRLIIRR